MKLKVCKTKKMQFYFKKQINKPTFLACFYSNQNGPRYCFFPARASKGFPNSPLKEPAAMGSGGGHIRDTSHSHLDYRKDSVPAGGASGFQRGLEKEARGQQVVSGGKEAGVAKAAKNAGLASHWMSGNNTGFNV